MDVATIDISFDDYDNKLNTLSGYQVGDDINYTGDMSTDVNVLGTVYGNISSELDQHDGDIATIEQEVIDDMSASYTTLRNKFVISDQKTDELNKLVSKFHIISAKLDNSNRTKTFYLLLVWIFISLFVGIALFISVIEDKKQMNIFSKTILLLFAIVISIYIARNMWVYIERSV